MPILLDTPWNPGQYDPGVTYPRAKIVRFEHSDRMDRSTQPGGVTKQVKVTIQFGDMDVDKWVPGDAQKDMSVCIIDDPSGTPHPYTDIVTDMPQQGENTYEAAKRALYNYLVNAFSELAGTVE